MSRNGQRYQGIEVAHRSTTDPCQSEAAEEQKEMDSRYPTLRVILSLVAAFFFLPANAVLAKKVTFQREYKYQASEADSKLSCRAIALEQVKRLLLEGLGTYLESETEVRNFKLSKDQITTLTAGIVQTEIIAEKWDGEEYWLRAKIVADPREVAKAIDSLRKNRQKTKELAEARERARQALKEVERLKEELALARAKGKTKTGIKREYDEAINELSAADWLEKGHAFDRTNLYEDRIKALAAYSAAIRLSPRSPSAYLARGAIYGKQGQYDKAIADFNRCLKIDQNIAEAHYNLGTIYIWKGQYDRAIVALTRCLQLNPGMTSAYHNRSVAYKRKGDYDMALKDLKRARNPKLQMVYTKRGNVYAENRQYDKALAEYSNALAIDPRYALAYYNRGITYWNLRDKQKAINDFKVAAGLGNEDAKSFLNSQGIK
jgi:tetratricopeptide (TPR) repeat protein